MAVRININLRGFDAEMRRVRNAKQQIVDEIDDELKSAAYNISNAAKRAVSIDEGTLKNSIQVDDTKPLEKEVTVNAFYAPYIEFGTGRKVQIPNSYSEYAAQFKGKADRGNMMSFFYELVQWVRRKGISGVYRIDNRRRVGSKKNQANEDYEAAYSIMLSILRNGVTPQPFFIPALERGKTEVVKRIKDVLKRYE